MLTRSPFPSLPTGDGPCFCCRRAAGGFGKFAGGDTPNKIIWACLAHASLLEKAISMGEAAFRGFEDRSISEAGQQGGAYLDHIGKSDLAALTGAEFTTFLETVVCEFGDSMARLLNSAEAPF